MATLEVVDAKATEENTEKEADAMDVDIIDEQALTE